MLNESLQADAAMVASVGGRRMVVPWVEAVQDDLSYWTDVVGRIRTILGPGANVMIEIVYDWKQHAVGGGKTYMVFRVCHSFLWVKMSQTSPPMLSC